MPEDVTKDENGGWRDPANLAALLGLKDKSSKNSVDSSRQQAALGSKKAADNLREAGLDHKNAGKKASNSSKNEAHGDGGRSWARAERDIAKLQEKLNQSGLSRSEKEKIRNKIDNIRKTAQKKGKGENHSRRGK